MKDEIPDDTVTEACYFQKTKPYCYSTVNGEVEKRCKKHLLRIKLMKKMLYMIIKVKECCLKKYSY